MDPVAYKNKSLYDNVDPSVLYDYADEADEDQMSCFGKIGCGSSKTSGGTTLVKGRTLPRFVKDKISPLFRIASRCTTASPVTSVSHEDLSRSLTRSASSDDLHTLEVDLGATVLYIDVRKGKLDKLLLFT